MDWLPSWFLICEQRPLLLFGIAASPSSCPAFRSPQPRLSVLANPEDSKSQTRVS